MSAAPRFGYGTNGFANHRLTDALKVIAELGYEGVALTLDHDHLDPFAPGLAIRAAQIADLLRDLNLAVVIETGARFLLDPWHKHAPTLLHDDRALRLDFLRRAIAVGADLGAEAVSFWAGVRPASVPADLAWRRLVEGCAEAGAAADLVGVPLGFEPEPGMLVEDIAGWRRLRADLGAPSWFGLTLDIGHCRCLEPLGVAESVADVAEHLVNVQIDDMRRGVHEHLEFGTGEIDFPPVLRALADGGYRGLVAVELPRHSHAAPTVAASSLTFLRDAWSQAEFGFASAGSAPAGPAAPQAGARPAPAGSAAPAAAAPAAASEASSLLGSFRRGEPDHSGPQAAAATTTPASPGAAPTAPSGLADTAATAAQTPRRPQGAAAGGPASSTAGPAHPRRPGGEGES